MLAGHATQEWTTRFAEWAVGKKGPDRDHFREFRGLRLSSLGVGTYWAAWTPRRTIWSRGRSIASGAVSVIDTAITGAHEREPSHRDDPAARRARIQGDLQRADLIDSRGTRL